MPHNHYLSIVSAFALAIVAYQLRYLIIWYFGAMLAYAALATSVRMVRRLLT